MQHLAWRRAYSESVDYYTDMLRKTVLSIAAPRLMKAGDSVLALQMILMADNARMPHYAVRHLDNRHGAAFYYADRMSANTLAQFVDRLASPQTAQDSFYLAHGSYHADYWNDMVGTHLLREARYDEAIPWLEKVSHGYQRKMAIYPYTNRDPFDVDAFYHRCRNRCRTDYKLGFARRMAQLAQYPNEPDPDKRASMMLDYAIGMENSVYPCWALTQYFYGYNHPAYQGTGREWEENWLSESENCNPHVPKEMKNFKQRSAKLKRLALATFRNPEKKAEALWRVGEYKTVKKHYSRTRFAQKKRGQCDRWNLW